jgi:hypothetical protein
MIVELSGERIPPPLALAIASQPSTKDEWGVEYPCGCRIEPYDEPLLRSTRWALCDRHRSTLLQAGRMISG